MNNLIKFFNLLSSEERTSLCTYTIYALYFVRNTINCYKHIIQRRIETVNIQYLYIFYVCVYISLCMCGCYSAISCRVQIDFLNFISIILIQHWNRRKYAIDITNNPPHSQQQTRSYTISYTKIRILDVWREHKLKLVINRNEISLVLQLESITTMRNISQTMV